ncbi:flagellar brake protein [Noviherbaspirillum sp. UKPF54]|uniref:flagellar brake protein n=1 Tax=Noviherbaspirillum sp. UKPF54 TaxID=2601898 RepID=UPI0011B155C6|nr:flagellar brake protein [Noviherbaspirillum sp. UKPF54]QDZ28963.1 flagellar brake protein [Noviherbaspirillum sp. UKPF54]
MTDFATNNFAPIPFEEMNLQVGTRLQIMVVRDQKPTQYFTTLIGYVKDEYMLMKIPVEHGVLMSFHEGEKLTIRVFTGVKVCSFNTFVERVFMHPYFYAHLTFPKSVRAASLRMAMRVKVDIAGTIAPREAGAAGQMPVRIDNLSISGALLESSGEIGKRDDNVVLSFVLPIQPGNHEVPISAQARICNTGLRKASAPNKPDIHVCGVQFVALDSMQEMALQNLTYEAQIGDRHKLV